MDKTPKNCLKQQKEKFTKLLSQCILGVIAVYRYCVSPLLGHNCRFHPTCSVYTAQAIQTFGLGKGLILAFKRILRCHPFCQGGIDELPDKK